MICNILINSSELRFLLRQLLSVERALRASFHLRAWLGYLPNMWQRFWPPFLGLIFKWLIPRSSDQIKNSGKIIFLTFLAYKVVFPHPVWTQSRVPQTPVGPVSGPPLAAPDTSHRGRKEDSPRKLQSSAGCGRCQCLRSGETRPEKLGAKFALHLVLLRKTTSFREPCKANDVSLTSFSSSLTNWILTEFKS